VITYGSFIEPRLIKITQTDIKLDKLDQNVKIALITDTHLGPYKKQGFVKKIVQKTFAQNPDLILLGGDFIFQKEDHIRYLEPIKILCSEIPCFAVTGNHEYNLGKAYDPKIKDKTGLLRQLFYNWNIILLENQNQSIDIKGQTILIAGISDLWTGLDDLDQASQNLPEKSIKLLLSHNPDIIMNPTVENYDLILSGHTHAGQIRLPLIGSVASIPTEIGRAYDQGLFKLKKGYLYIASGLGESGTRARLFNRPELSIINLN